MAPVLELKHITCSYDLEKSPALQDVSLSLEAGERLALVGPNGAGKSTLFLAALGLLPLSAGEIRLEGRRVNPNKRRELDLLRSSVGLLFQNPDDQLLAPTVEGEAAFGPRNLGLPPQEVKSRVDKAQSPHAEPGKDQGAQGQHRRQNDTTGKFPLGRFRKSPAQQFFQRRDAPPHEHYRMGHPGRVPQQKVDDKAAEGGRCHRHCASPAGGLP